MTDHSRKDFLATLGTVGASVAMPAAAEACADPTEVAQTHTHSTPPMHMAAAGQKPLGERPEAYSYFTEPEWKFVEAAVERLIPTDALGAGGREAGCAYYIDQQLGGQFGYAAKMYTQGPWLAPSPTQGYQLPLNPREVYRLGIAATNRYTHQTYGKTFDKLDAQHQDTVLAALEAGKVTFVEVPAQVFFEMLYGGTVEGFFSDPMYGGNRDKVGWKLVGFPGAAAAYLGLVERHNVPYKVTPMSISDLQQQETAMGTEMSEADVAHRVAMHVMLGRRALNLPEK
jgi:gluconate 2-dehydrogenase gamma chain